MNLNYSYERVSKNDILYRHARFAKAPWRKWNGQKRDKVRWALIKEQIFRYSSKDLFL